VLGADDEEELILEQRMKLERLLSARLKPDGQIDPVFHHAVHHLVTVARLDGKGAIGIVPFELDEDGRDDVLTGGGAGSDTQTALAPLAQLLERNTRGVHFPQYFLGVYLELFACLGHKNFFAHPVKKTTSNILLQSSHGVADGGLGQEQFFGGKGKTSHAGKGGKGLELTAIDRVIHL
jgi:hypothetical protein